MSSVKDWAEIRRLHRAEGMPIKAIARAMGCSKNTVKRALAAAEPPRYQRRAGGGSIVDAVEPRIRELLQAWPTMPATVRPGAHRDQAAGADDGDRLCAVAGGPAAAVAGRRGPVCRLVAAARPARQGAADAGMEQSRAPGSGFCSTVLW